MFCSRIIYILLIHKNFKIESLIYVLKCCNNMLVPLLFCDISLFSALVNFSTYSSIFNSWYFFIDLFWIHPYSIRFHPNLMRCWWSDVTIPHKRFLSNSGWEFIDIRKKIRSSADQLLSDFDENLFNGRWHFATRGWL